MPEEILTAKTIVQQAEKCTDNPRTVRRNINRLFREQDDSHLWPVLGKFNVTDCAIS